MPTNPAGGLVLSSDRYADILEGGAGADTLNAGQGPDRLTGGAGADAFTFKAMPWNGVQITDFELGADRLEISALYQGGFAGPDPVAAGYVRFESNGAGGTKVMLDPDGAGSASPWAYHVATLDGVSPTGLSAAQVFGGLRAAAQGQRLVSDRYADELTGGAGDDTLVGGQGPDRLTGAEGADVFVYTAKPWNGGEIADFELGVDRLDISALFQGGYAGANPVTDGYVRFESDGAGSTKVMLDPDGAGASHAWSSLVTILKGISPEAATAASVFGAPEAAPQPGPAPQPGVALTSTGYGQALLGGAGADTLTAGRGPDVLTGSAGDDRFVFEDLPWNAGHVRDFTRGDDVLDLRPLFADAGYTGQDPIADGYLRFEADGAGGARVMFDPDGAQTGNPWAFHVTTLDGVAPASLTPGDWLAV
jgi:Ca2+-binding RTX toxin-like protein